MSYKSHKKINNNTNTNLSTSDKLDVIVLGLRPHTLTANIVVGLDEYLLIILSGFESSCVQIIALCKWPLRPGHQTDIFVKKTPFLGTGVPPKIENQRTC